MMVPITAARARYEAVIVVITAGRGSVDPVRSRVTSVVVAGSRAVLGGFRAYTRFKRKASTTWRTALLVSGLGFFVLWYAVLGRIITVPAVIIHGWLLLLIVVMMVIVTSAIVV
ncbi:hypothetical protein L798_06058 [Zootermopsis nevadensis]|uniref:Uncharacterized protein n=1 Tax=Zootermopsis nevadensis TaxID=136037 RepID=A0A067RJM8_ZOONE|nr:hypothetical protein L798_06058 [Zootermopsis nevadensis]